MPLFPALARACLFGLFAHGIALAQPADEPAPLAIEATAEERAKLAEMAERHRVNVDNVLGLAPQDGMALLVIPTINLDAEGERDFDDRAARNRFARQSSTFMHWRKKTDDGYAISVGQGKHKFDPADVGSVFQTPRGAITYQVIPVWPGEYGLNRITYRQPRATIPELVERVDLTARLEKSGMATLLETTDRDFRKTGPWPRQAKQNEDGLGVGCEVVLRFGGGCDEAAREYRWQVSAGIALNQGDAEAVPVRGFDAELIFAPMASIKLEKGEVVLTDGFLLRDGQPVLAKNMCDDLSGEVVCAIESLVVERLPASIEDFRQARSAGSFGLPQTEAALRGLVYRAPTIHGKPVAGATPNLLRPD